MLGGSRLARPFTMVVISVGMMMATTGATALVVAVRSDGGPRERSAHQREATKASPTPEREPPVTDLPALPLTSAVPTTTGSTQASTVVTTASSCSSMRTLTTRGKLAQLLFVSVSDATSAKAALSGPASAGGVLVLNKGTTWFGNGVLKDIAAAAAVPPLVAADEEGGRVQRIDAFAGRMPSAYQMGRMTPEKVRETARLRGVEMAKLGFTMDFAPVVDLYDGGNAVIRDRAFSSDPEKVVTYGRAFADGLRSAGITPVLKHFPGHGRSTGDSHKQAVQTPPLAELTKSDLKPFKALASTAPAVMVGHLDVPGLTDPGRPTSVSAKAIDGLLRRDLGFQGLVITDDLSAMRAITDRFSVPEAVLASIMAGADVAIIDVAQMSQVLSSLERAVKTGKLSRAQIDRALGRLSAVKCP